MQREMHGAFKDRRRLGRIGAWMLGFVCAAAMAFGTTPAYAIKTGNRLPNLGLESSYYGPKGGYQFTSGMYYRLTDEGKYVEESTEDDWNIRWTGDTSAGTLELRDAHIKGTFFVPGGTTIKVIGDCSVTVGEVAIQQQTDGNLTIDLASGSKLTLDCISQGENLYSGPNTGSGDVSIIGQGTLVYGAREYKGGLVVKEGTLHIGGNVIVRDLAGAQPNSLIAQDILIDGNANIDMQGKIGQIACTNSLTVGGNARVKVSGTDDEVVTYATDLKVTDSAEFTIENTEPDGFATASYNNGPITVEGSGKLIASAVSDNYAVISTGSSSSTKASDITVTGSGSISTRGGFNGVEASGANSALRVSDGGKVSVTGAYNGIDLSGSKGMFVDGGTIEVTDCSSAVEVDGSSAEQPATISIKNGSTLSFNVRNKGIWATNFIDGYELSDSTVRSVTGECFSSSDPTTFSYSTDANLKIGDSAESATAVDIDKMDFQAKYVEIVPSSDHTWASEWTTDATHHWHACTNSHCTLDPTADVAQMGDYAEHSGGAATCVAKASCAACGKEYGNVNASNHTNLVKTEARPASHLSTGNIAYWHCEGCNKYFSDEAGTKEIALKDTVIPRLSGHIVDSSGWHSDATDHWKTCICGARLDEAAHDFVWVIDAYPTATEAGSKHEECETCGYARAAVEIPIPVFSDVVPGSWYADSVVFVAGRGLMTGYDNSDLFGVGHSLTRGELATILWRHAVKPSEDFDPSGSKNETDISDVADGQFYTEAANWAVENGIISGYDMPDGSCLFAPNDPVTLEQMVTVIGRLTAGEEEIAGTDSSVLDRYGDKSGISDWAVKAVAWATQVGLVGGYDLGDGAYEIRATESVARERAATILTNAFSIGLLK